MKSKFLWIGLGCLGICILGGCLLVTLGFFFWRSTNQHPTPVVVSAPAPAPGSPAFPVTRAPPVASIAPTVINTDQLNKAVLASPALAERKSDANPADSLFRVVGTPKNPQARPWTNGGQVLLCSVDVEMRPSATAPWSRGQALVEITVDDRGNTLTTRTLHIKGPDELELERLAR